MTIKQKFVYKVKCITPPTAIRRGRGYARSSNLLRIAPPHTVTTLWGLLVYRNYVET